MHVAALLASTVISFGRTGGNILPFAVSVSQTGAVTTSGPVSAPKAIPVAAVNGLLTLARAERFAALPRRVACKGVLPDVASLYITIAGRTVTVHGACNRQFSELYAVLQAVAVTG